MRSIGIRELRQNASTYVRAAERGETIEVTDRGRPVARLAPLERGSVIEELIATGRAKAPTRPFYPLPEPLPPAPGQRPLSEILAEMREDER